MRHFLRRLAKLDGARQPPALRALIACDDPAARLLFEGDGRPRAVVDRGLRLLRGNAALDCLLSANPARKTLADLFAPEAAVLAVQTVEAAMTRAVAPHAGTTALGHLATPGHIATLDHIATLGRHTDGMPRAMGLTIAPVREADGTVSGAVLTLEPTGTSHTNEVHARKLQAVGALAGGVAHDFNNLLQAIIGAAESLAERPSLAASEREDVSLILDGARRGADLVRQLLAFSAQQTLQPRMVAVNQAVTDLAPLLRRSLGKRVRLELALQDPDRVVHVDPGQLDQVLVNLAVNARDAMPDGGTLTLRTARLTLLAPRTGGLATIPRGRYVAIEVHDTGTGIPAAILPRIFEPFFTTRRERGTGLGLSTVLGIIHQSRGFLEVASTPGHGTLFRILLPRSQEPAIAVTTNPGTAPPDIAPHVPPGLPAISSHATRGIVLLVEDEDAVRRLAQRALERHGWRVLSADCAEAALDLIAPDSPIACIVTDMIMPGIDGAALARAVREKLARPTLPAIIVSGYAEVPLHDAIAAAATAFLPKPYAMKQLAARVAALARDVELVEIA